MTPEIRLAREDEIAQLSALSVRVGNIPLVSGKAIASLLIGEHGEISGFAAVQQSWHTAGSWVKQELRGNGLSYQLRDVLDRELRKRGIPVYIAIPGDDFEKSLFAKYGHVTEHLAQVRHL